MDVHGLDSCWKCMFLGKDGELLTESRKVQSRHFLIELFSGRDRRTNCADNAQNLRTGTGRGEW